MSRSRRPQKSAKPKAAKPAAGRDFWGSQDAIADDVALIRPATDPSALIRSLGVPPLVGQEKVAEHYFRAVYDKAAGLAIALAAAGGLLDDGTEQN